MRSGDLIRRRLSTVAVTIVSGCLIALVGAPRAHSAFPGLNGRIAFASDRDGAQDIYVMNADGTGQTRLTDAASDDQYPSWSPDGTRLVFSSFREGVQKLFTMNPDGSAQTRLIDNPLGGSGDEEPAWSRSGGQIAFRSDRELGLQIWRVNANGTGLARLTQLGLNLNPSWLPGIDQILFASDRDGDLEIYTMDAVGLNVVQRTFNDASDSNPDYSNARVAFQSDRDGDFDIYVLNPDGTVDQLTNDPARDSAPSWSPDGTKLVFQSNRDGDFEIFTMNADGSGVVQLTHNTALDRVPDWQPVTLGGSDTTPPAIVAPGPITVNATSPAGAAVSFTVTVSDVVDPSPTLQCSHTPGTFPIGATTVTCTASDRAGNTSSASFLVTVVGAGEQLRTLFLDVISASTLTPTQKAFLSARLQTALASFNPDSRAQNCVAETALGIFSIVVSGLRGNGVEPAIADRWLADARRIRNVLNC